ncbi:MAG: hypothetical protein IM638_19970 [Bacteroidetes bacterium]|nr:hypothetical protein [Bacteroidota bacterium]
MNQFIRDSYQKLNEHEKARLKREFADSPKMLRLIELIAKRDNKLLNTYEAVNFVYAREKESFDVLRNRFFKLRKKLAETLEQVIKPAGDTASDLLPYEAEYYRCRQLLLDAQFNMADKRLEVLYKNAFNDQVLELLPDVLHQRIYIAHVLHDVERIEKLLVQHAEATAAYATLLKMRELNRKIALSVFGQDFDLDAMFNQMSTLARRHRQFPRLQFYYHFTRFTISASTKMVKDKSVYHHLTACRKMLAARPAMPAAIYEPGGDVAISFQLKVAEAMLAYHNNNAEESYNHMKVLTELINTYPTLRHKRSEAIYLNLLSIQIATARYSEALSNCDDLLRFHKEKGIPDKHSLVWMSRLEVYSYAWPELKAHDTDTLFKKSKDFLNELKKQKDARYHTYYIMFILAQVLIGNRKAGLRAANDKLVRKLYQDWGFGFYNDFFDTLRKGWKPQDVELLRNNLLKLSDGSVDGSLNATLNILLKQLNYIKP